MLRVASKMIIGDGEDDDDDDDKDDNVMGKHIFDMDNLCSSIVC